MCSRYHRECCISVFLAICRYKWTQSAYSPKNASKQPTTALAKPPTKSPTSFAQLWDLNVLHTDAGHAEVAAAEVANVAAPTDSGKLHRAGVVDAYGTIAINSAAKANDVSASAVVADLSLGRPLPQHDEPMTSQQRQSNTDHFR